MAEQDDKSAASQPVSETGSSGGAPRTWRTSSRPTSRRRAKDRGGKQPARTVVVERRRGFFARWLSRLVALLLVLGILLLLAFVGITLVLRSDVPRSLAESVASEALGLQLGLADLDVGWDGDVTIRDLVVRLPSLDGAPGELIAEVPRINAELGALPRVALDYLRGGDPRVRRLEILSPVIYATQGPGGEWNLARAASLAGRGGQPEDPQASGGGMPPLPELRVTDGQIVIRDGEGAQSRLEGIQLSGGRENPLVYTIAGRAPGIELAGELFPASGRRQQVSLVVAKLPPELLAMFGLPEVALRADWRGGMTAGGVEGVIDVTSARVGATELAGVLHLSSIAGTTILRPEAVSGDEGLRGVTATDVPGVGTLNIIEGAITAAGPRIEVHDLLAQAMGGEMLVRNATVNLADLAVDLTLGFKNLQPSDKADLTGELTVSAGYDAFGEPMAEAHLTATGSISDTRIERLGLRVAAAGPFYHDWRTLDVLVTLEDSPLLIRPPDAPTTLPEAEALVLVRLTDPVAPRIELSHLRSLEPDLIELRGTGVYYTAPNAQFQQGEYLVSFEQRGLPVKIPRVDGKYPLNFGFDLEGRYYRAADPSQSVVAPIQITRIFGDLVDVTLEGAGRYVIISEGEQPQPPLALSLTLTRQSMIPSPLMPGAPEVIGAQRALNPPAGSDDVPAEDEVTGPQVEQVQPIRGTITSWLEVVGDPMAMKFGGAGGILTSNFAVGPFELGTVQSLIELTLTADDLTIYTPRNRERTDLEWQYAQLFGAHLDFEAVIPFRDEQPGHITLDIQQMQLPRLAEALAMPPVRGTLDAHLAVDLTGLSPSLAETRGWILIHRPGAGRIELAEQIVIGRPPRQPEDDPHGGVILQDGQLSLPVELRQFAAEAPGPSQLGEQRTLSFNLSYDLRQPRSVQVLNLEADGYPVVLPPAGPGGVYVDSELTLSSPAIVIGFEEKTPRVRGHVEASVDMQTGERPFELEPFGQGTLVAEATRARVELEQLHANLADIGLLRGGGTIELDDVPGLSQVWIHGQSLDLAAAARKLNLPEGTEGLVDFSLTVQPGPGEHPQGEVLVNLAFSGEKARWRSVEIDQGQVMVYLSRIDLPDGTPPRGQYDFTLATTERVRLQLAGGVIDGYFKLRNRGRAEEAGQSTIFAPLAGAGDDWYVNATMDGEDLNLAQIGELFYDQPVEGNVTISAIAYGNLHHEPRFGVVEEDVPLFPLSGEGSLLITDARLRRFNLFNRIVNLVTNLITLQAQPRDRLQTEFRLEQGHGYVESLEAMVDGYEIRMSGRLYDVLEPDRTRIEASGLILRRPLSQIPLPFFRELDEFLTIVQSSATAFRASGPLKDPYVVQVLFSEVVETLRVLLAPTLKGR